MGGGCGKRGQDVIYLNERFWLVRHTPASQAPGKIVAMPATTPWASAPPETKTNPRYSSVFREITPGSPPA